MLRVRRSLRDPPLEKLDILRADRAAGPRRRHALRRLPRRDTLVHPAGRGTPPRDRAVTTSVLRGLLAPAQPRDRHARPRPRSEAGEADPRKHGAKVAFESHAR